MDFYPQIEEEMTSDCESYGSSIVGDLPEPESRFESSYTLLGIKEEATADEIKRAYRSKALMRHPDKGGDEDEFHKIEQAYRLLSDPVLREAYDQELERRRERARLVEGGPAERSTRTVARVLTAPTPGSTRSRKKEAVTAGWKAIGSAGHVLKALCDDTTAEAQTAAVFQKYAALPKVKEQKREWVSCLQGHEKAALKAHAKEQEIKAMKKAMTWLNKGPSGGKNNKTSRKGGAAAFPVKKPAEVALPQASEPCVVLPQAGEGHSAAEPYVKPETLAENSEATIAAER